MLRSGRAADFPVRPESPQWLSILRRARLAGLCLPILSLGGVSAVADTGDEGSGEGLRESFHAALSDFHDAPDGSLKSDELREKVVRLAYSL